MKKRIAILSVLVLTLALVVMAQTNSGIFRITNSGFVLNGVLGFEATPGAGQDAALLRNAANSIEIVQGDGATVVGVLSGSEKCGTVVACSASYPAKSFHVYGSAALSGGAATLTGLPYTATGNFFCTAVDQTAANAVKIVPASATTATLAGTTTDVVSWSCDGN